MKEIFSRLVSETPTFFKRVQILGGSIVATATAILTIPNVPAVVTDKCSIAIWVGGVIAALSQLACKNPDDVAK